MRVDSASVTLPDEGPEQRWRRTVRKRPAKLKLGRLLRDFGYSELDDDVADAIEARMAGVGLAVRPPLRQAAADEIVTVYRPQGADDDVPAAADAVAARPPEPVAPAAPEPPRPRPRRTGDPDSARMISDLKGQLADARAESERLRTELEGRIAAMADADRLAGERLAEQSAVVDDQTHRLAELSGLLHQTRAALAEARDEIRRTLGDMPAAIVEAPAEDGGLSAEEGWLTDADEPLPPSAIEAAASAIALPADEPDEPDEPDGPGVDAEAPPPHDAGLDPVASRDVFAGPGEALSDEDVFAADAGWPPSQEDPGAGADPSPEVDDLVFKPELPASAEVPAQDDEFVPEPDMAPQEDVFGALPEDEAFSFEPADGPPPETVARPPAPPRRSGFFTLQPQPAARDDGADSDGDPPPAQDTAAQEPVPVDEWRLDDEQTPAGTPAGEIDLELADWHADDGLQPADLAFDPPADASGEPEPAAWAPDATGALPPPPPLPPLPFADDVPARPPKPAERPSRPAKRGRMARGRGRWEGTCSVCERFPETTRRRDLEADGWQLDGDFPTCPQCRGLA